MKYRLPALFLLVVVSGCGGSGPSSPSTTPPPTVPTASACGALGQTISSSTSIVNGAECSSANSAIVLLNLKDLTGAQAGSCTGTVIAARAVLTAAHCLHGEIGSISVFLGTGPQQVTTSFAAHPSWRESNATQYDVGVLLMPADIGRTPVPLLLSRDARGGNGDPHWLGKGCERRARDAARGVGDNHRREFVHAADHVHHHREFRLPGRLGRSNPGAGRRHVVDRGRDLRELHAGVFVRRQLLRQPAAA